MSSIAHRTRERHERKRSATIDGVPLYEIAPSGDLLPFSRLGGGPDLYEREIEGLFWDNPDEFWVSPCF